MGTSNLQAIYQELIEQRNTLLDRIFETQDEIGKIEAQLELIDRIRGGDAFKRNTPTSAPALPAIAPIPTPRKRTKPRNEINAAIRKLIRAEPGLTSIDVINTLENQVTTKSKKGIRRVISNRIFALKKRFQIEERGDGGLYFIPKEQRPNGESQTPQAQ